MADRGNDEPMYRRTHTMPAAASYLEVGLDRAIEDLHREPEWTRGQNARTLVKYDNLRVVLIVLAARARIPAHDTDGPISLQLLRGRVHVRAEGRTFNLQAGSLLTLDHGLRHEVEAIEDSAFLLTIARPTPAPLPAA